MTLELAQVIAQLVQAIAAVREAEGGQDGLMDLLGRPATDVRSAVQEDFHQPDDARLVDLDAGIAHRADGDRQSDALQERKVHVNVEPVAWKDAKRLVMACNFSRTASRLSKPFLSPKSLRLLEQSSLRRNVENFSYCFRKACLK